MLNKIISVRLGKARCLVQQKPEGWAWLEARLRGGDPRLAGCDGNPAQGQGEGFKGTPKVLLKSLRLTDKSQKVLRTHRGDAQTTNRGEPSQRSGHAAGSSFAEALRALGDKNNSYSKSILHGNGITSNNRFTGNMIVQTFCKRLTSTGKLSSLWFI